MPIIEIYRARIDEANVGPAAVRLGVIASSPADRLTSAERPKPGSGRRRSLDRHEVELLLCAAPDLYRITIACGLFLGLRLPELLGLTWSQIDFRGDVIRVRHQMGRDGRRRRLKTAAARRDVILMTQLAGELRRMRLASPFSAGGLSRLLQHDWEDHRAPQLTARGLQ